MSFVLYDFHFLCNFFHFVSFFSIPFPFFSFADANIEVRKNVRLTLSRGIWQWSRVNWSCTVIEHPPARFSFYHFIIEQTLIRVRARRINVENIRVVDSTKYDAAFFSRNIRSVTLSFLPSQKKKKKKNTRFRETGVNSVPMEVEVRVRGTRWDVGKSCWVSQKYSHTETLTKWIQPSHSRCYSFLLFDRTTNRS